jgi:Effector Associated Constant Component 1
VAVTVELVISPVDPGDGQTVMSLYRWLSRDTRVAHHARVTIQHAGRQRGEMGGAFDVINAVFADGGAAAGIGSLLVAYRVWRDTRTRPPAFTVEKDGLTVVIDQGSEQEIQQVLTMMLPETRAAGPAVAAEEEPGGS